MVLSTDTKLSVDQYSTGKNYISQDGWSGDALPKVNSD